MNWSSPSDAIASMLHAVDRRDWPAVRRSFTDRVVVDYSSLNGAPEAEADADELIAGWQTLLPGFDATQHLLGPVLLSRDGEAAVGETHVRGYHYVKEAPAGGVWMVAGHYTVRLVQQAGAWRISTIRLTVFYQEGNLALPEVARARAVTSPRAGHL